MTTPEPRRITIEHLMAVTGLGPNQVRHDVWAGELPGRMRGRQYVCPPGEYDRWVRGDWTPTVNPDPDAEPVSLVHRRRAS